MQSNKLRMAIRATAAVAVLGMAGQAQAFSFSAGDVDAELYGYARLNMSYDMDANVADDSQSGAFVSSSTPKTGDGHFGASAQQSRVGINLTNADGVKINVEGDFFGGDFRLRHAYGEYRGVLAGQTWSNYNSFTGSTPTLDFSGYAGNAGYQLRTAQLRYTTGGLSLAVEDPQGGPDTGFDKNETPALTARFEGSTDALSFAAGALVKQTAYENETTNNDDSATGFATFGAAKFQLSDMISIQGTLNYTDGAIAYLYRAGGPDGEIDANGDIDTLSGYGGSIGTSLNLGGGRSVNLVYGTTVVEYDADDQTNQTAFINYMWTPVQNVMMGVEYGYYDTEDVSGNSEDANRLMFAAQYNF